MHRRRRRVGGSNSGTASFVTFGEENARAAVGRVGRRLVCGGGDSVIAVFLLASESEAKARADPAEAVHHGCCCWGASGMKAGKVCIFPMNQTTGTSPIASYDVEGGGEGGVEVRTRHHFVIKGGLGAWKKCLLRPASQRSPFATDKQESEAVLLVSSHH